MNYKNHNEIDRKVADLYSRFPYPSTPIKRKSELFQSIIYDTVYYLVKEYIDAYDDKRIKIIDVGCGTGELALGLAAKLGSRAVVLGIDRNDKSLDVAKERAKKWKINNVTFKHVDLTKDKFPDGPFDFVFSIGVIHHIPETKKMFGKLVKITKTGGYIATGFYNPYGMVRDRLERQLLKILAGTNIEKRMKLAKKLYYRRELTPHEEVWAADTYAHPFQQYFSIEELLKWFRENNIEYLASEPPIEPKKNLALLKELIKSKIKGENISLVKLWQRSLTTNYKSSKWEKSPLVTFPTQLTWMMIGMVYGRGEFVNIIGKKT